MLYLDYNAESNRYLFIRDGQCMLFTPDNPERFKRIFGIGERDWFNPVECGFVFERSGLTHVFASDVTPMRWKGEWKVDRWSRMTSGRIFRPYQLAGLAHEKFSHLRSLFEKVGKEPYLYLWNIGAVIFSIDRVGVKRLD